MNRKSSNCLMLDSDQRSCIKSDMTSIIFFFRIMISLHVVSSCIGVCDSGLPMILCSGIFPFPSLMIPLTRYFMKKSRMKSSIVQSTLPEFTPSYYFPVTPISELRRGLTSFSDIPVICAMLTRFLNIENQSLLGSALSYQISLLESLFTMI